MSFVVDLPKYRNIDFNMRARGVKHEEHETKTKLACSTSQQAASFNKG
jgi:hypothetical protein